MPKFFKTPALVIPLAGIIACLGLAGLCLRAARGGETGIESVARPGIPPVRIVSLAPSVTEILFALGLDGHIAGVTSFCDYPAAARQIPCVGGFKGKSIETIVGLSPDLVIGTRDGNESRLFAALDRLGVRTLSVQPANLEQILTTIADIGRAAGREPEADTLIREMQSRLDDIDRRVRGRKPVQVLFTYGRDPLVLAGPGTFADDLIRRAGGVNVASDAIMPYPRFSMEAVVARAPEVIVEGLMGTETPGRQADAAVKHWSRWPMIPAVENHRVVLIDQDLIARPGPRIIDGLEQLARALHPEAFGEAAP